MVRLGGGDRMSGSKSHDQEGQQVSKTAAKTAENSVRRPGNWSCAVDFHQMLKGYKYLVRYITTYQISCLGVKRGGENTV